MFPVPTKNPVAVSGMTMSFTEDMVPKESGALAACFCVAAKMVWLATTGNEGFERGVTTQSSTRETAKLVTAAHEAMDRTVRDGS